MEEIITANFLDRKQQRKKMIYVSVSWNPMDSMFSLINMPIRDREVPLSGENKNSIILIPTMDAVKIIDSIKKEAFVFELFSIVDISPFIVRKDIFL